MSTAGVAISLHILGVIWWIGGLAFVTLVFIPALRAGVGNDPMVLMGTIEHRFAPQARIALVLVGVSGAYLLSHLNAWSWLTLGTFWWLQAMLGYWLLFALVLFVIEPLGILDKLLSKAHDPATALRWMHWLHAMLLSASVPIIVGAAAGTHGY